MSYLQQHTFLVVEKIMANTNQKKITRGKIPEASTKPGDLRNGTLDSTRNSNAKSMGHKIITVKSEQLTRATVILFEIIKIKNKHDSDDLRDD